jgi:DNA-binding MarR family transcriptional regulator
MIESSKNSLRLSEDPTGPLNAEASGLSDFLTYRILRAHHALNAQAVDLLSRRGQLTLGQWRVLALVGAGLAGTMKDVAVASTLDPAFISRTVRKLHQDGLMETRRPDEDRRQVELTLTGVGREIYDQILPVMQARQDALLEALDVEERRMIFSALEKIEVAASRRDL